MKIHPTHDCPSIRHIPAALVFITIGLSIGLCGSIRIDDVDVQRLNGMFYPRSSELFFQEGLDRMEDEIMRLQGVDEDVEGDRPILNPILDIDESIPMQQDELEEGDRWLIDDTDPVNRSDGEQVDRNIG